MRGVDVVGLALVSTVLAPLVSVLVAWLRRRLDLPASLDNESTPDPPRKGSGA